MRICLEYNSMKTHSTKTIGTEIVSKIIDFLHYPLRTCNSKELFNEKKNCFSS
jgi:hypothetical protein